MPSMTSKNRVLESLNHREPDRIAVDLSGYRSSGISAVTYPKLRAAPGLEPRTVDVYDPVQQLAICHDAGHSVHRRVVLHCSGQQLPDAPGRSHAPAVCGDEDDSSGGDSGQH
jgi:hypothetical protein